MDNLELKIKELIEEGRTRKYITEKLKITFYKFDKIKAKLIEENKINPNKKIKKMSSDLEEEYRKMIIDIICKKYLNYKNTPDFNSTLVLKLSQMHKNNSYQEILQSTIDSQKQLEYSSRKEFENDYYKISYLCAIIRNNIKNIQNTIIKKEKKKEKEVFVDIDEINKRRTSNPTKRRDLTEFLND